MNISKSFKSLVVAGLLLGSCVHSAQGSVASALKTINKNIESNVTGPSVVKEGAHLALNLSRAYAIVAGATWCLREFGVFETKLLDRYKESNFVQNAGSFAYSGAGIVLSVRLWLWLTGYAE